MWEIENNGMFMHGDIQISFSTCNKKLALSIDIIILQVKCPSRYKVRNYMMVNDHVWIYFYSSIYTRLTSSSVFYIYLTFILLLKDIDMFKFYEAAITDF